MPTITITTDEQALVDAYRNLKAKKAVYDTAVMQADNEQFAAHQAQVDMDVAEGLLTRLMQG